MSEPTTVYSEGEEFRVLVKKANIPNAKPEDVENLRSYLNRHPEIWNKVTHVANAAKEKTLECLGTKALSELTRAGMHDLAITLGYDAANSLERVLIEHIVLAWVNFHMIQFKYHGMTGKSISLSEFTFWEKSLTTSQRRYLRALETLAKVRKMKLPDIKVTVQYKL